MEIECSKKGEGKILIGIGCIKNDEGDYQKMLYIDKIKDGIDCKVGNKLHKDNVEKTLATLVFNKDESIDVLIKKLKELKCLDSKRTLEEQRGVFICDDPECSCQLTKGC